MVFVQIHCLRDDVEWGGRNRLPKTRARFHHLHPVRNAFALRLHHVLRKVEEHAYTDRSTSVEECSSVSKRGVTPPPFVLTWQATVCKNAVEPVDNLCVVTSVPASLREPRACVLERALDRAVWIERKRGWFEPMPLAMVCLTRRKRATSNPDSLFEKCV